MELQIKKTGEILNEYLSHCKGCVESDMPLKDKIDFLREKHKKALEFRKENTAVLDEAKAQLMAYEKAINELIKKIQGEYRVEQAKLREQHKIQVQTTFERENSENIIRNKLNELYSISQRTNSKFENLIANKKNNPFTIDQFKPLWHEFLKKNDIIEVYKKKIKEFDEKDRATNEELSVKKEIANAMANSVDLDGRTIKVPVLTDAKSLIEYVINNYGIYKKDAQGNTKMDTNGNPIYYDFVQSAISVVRTKEYGKEVPGLIWMLETRL